MKPLSLEAIKKEVMKIHGVDEEDQNVQTGVILLASAIVGPNITKIMKFTGYSRAEVSKRAKNCRKNKIWVKDKVSCDWLDENGGIAFICDCMVADGILQRS